MLLFGRLFTDALWSPAGEKLTYWLTFVISNCEVVTFPLVSWVRCGACLYRCLIFALFLTLILALRFLVIITGSLVNKIGPCYLYIPYVEEYTVENDASDKGCYWPCYNNR